MSKIASSWDNAPGHGGSSLLPLISLLLGVLALASSAPSAGAVDRLVPADFPSVQAAVDVAVDGDVIVIAPGTYAENVVITGRNITLRSTSGEPTDTLLEAALVLDDKGTPDPGDDELVPGNVVEVKPTASDPMDQPFPTRVVFMDLTVANGNRGVLIRPNVLVLFLDGRVIGNQDGIEIAGGTATTDGAAGAVVQRSVLELNVDDAVVSDHRSLLQIEDSTIQDNGGDGMEIRLQDDAFEVDEEVAHLILRNHFLRNGEDGLKLIDDQTLTPRSLRVERNVFADNAAAGLGMLCDLISVEDFSGCPIDEPVELVHNTFAGNDHGLAGGANLLGVNNLFEGHLVGVKNVVSPSQLSHTGFWDNVTDSVNSNLVASVAGDPLLTETYQLQQGSAAVDAGARLFPMVGEPILDSCDYRGLRPDLGAFELDTGPPVFDLFDVALTAASEDAFEKRGGTRIAGKVKIGGKRLDLGQSGVAGLRFEGMPIIPGTEVITASLQLTAAKKAKGKKPASIQIHGQASDDASPFSTTKGDLSTREEVPASVVWSPPPWPAPGASGPDQQTPNVAAVLNDIVGRPGWASGNALVLLIRGGGKRSVATLEGGGTVLLQLETCAP